MTSLLVVLVVLSVLSQCSALEKGRYPEYNVFCDQSGIKALSFDCTGFLQCDGNTAHWHSCIDGHYFDGKVSCLADKRNCADKADAAAQFCPLYPYLTFPHPESCTMFYNCSKVDPEVNFLPYVDECQFPMVYDSNTRQCVHSTLNTNYTCQGTKPVDQCSYRRSPCGQADCTGLPDGPNGHPAQPFDVEFLICNNSQVLSTEACSIPGDIFDPIDKICTSNYKASIAVFCQANPSAMFPSPESCSLIYNCSIINHHTELEPYQYECPYLFLFDPGSNACKYFTDVMCGLRPVPKAPCDYKIGQCHLRDACIPCDASCVGLPDGPNIYPGKALTADYLDCRQDRTIVTKICTGGEIFDPAVSTCGNEISIETLSLFCAKNPSMILAHPGECSAFYDCRKTTSSGQLTKYMRECHYNELFDPTDNLCKPRALISCGTRRKPVSKCQYLQYKCTTPGSCSPCEDNMPSCEGLANGFHPLVGEWMTSNYMRCANGQLDDIIKCSNGFIFDMAQKGCTQTVNKIALNMFCTAHPTASVADPQHCGRFFECQKQVTPAIKASTCNYPDVFSVWKQSCNNYLNVSCDGRKVEFDGCTYQDVNQCLGQPGCMCTFPSCINQIDGFTDEYPGDNGRYYTCRDKRAFVVQCLAPHTYDPAIKGCPAASTVAPTLEPTQQPTQKPTQQPTPPPTAKPTPGQVSTAVPATTAEPMMTTTQEKTTEITSTTTTPGGPTPDDIIDTLAKARIACANTTSPLIPHGSKCHWYYDCSKLMEVQECNYPLLFDVFSHMCMEYSLADCGVRTEAKQPCEYISHQDLFPTCNGPGCRDCEKRYPSCVGRPHNYRGPLAGNPSKYFECRDERTTIDMCPAGFVYDPSGCIPPSEVIVEATTVNEASTYCMQDQTQKVPHRDHCHKYFDCQNSINPVPQECSYPQTFNAAARVCSSIPSCGTRTEYKAPCDYGSVMGLYQCQSGQPCPKCQADYPSCVGKPNNFKGPIPSDDHSYFECHEERTIIKFCTIIGHIFLPFEKKCGIPPSKPLDILKPTAVEGQCVKTPTGLFPMESSCARYYDCNQEASALGRFVAECQPPLLFDGFDGKCVDPAVANCNQRHIEVDRCDYHAIKRQFCAVTLPACPTCEQANPSCRGKPDYYTGPVLIDLVTFYTCLNQRTTISSCFAGQMFNAARGSCEVMMQTTASSDLSTTPPPSTTPYTGLPTVSATDIGAFCAVNPTSKAAHPDSCAQYWDCNRMTPQYGVQFLLECQYPFFFNQHSGACESFTSVGCGARKEVMTPCEYIAFTVALCRNLTTCKNCEESQLNCRGKANGYKDSMRNERQRYFQCQSQRTTILSCTAGQQFDPILADCRLPTDKSIPVLSSEMEATVQCSKTPTGRFPHAHNCAQYWDCALPNGPYGRFLQECPYPELYEPTSATCKDHIQVPCGTREEPMLRCEYFAILKQYCQVLGTSCPDCTSVNPSCVAQTDGLKGAIPGSRSKYYSCLRDRTMLHECTGSQEFDTATKSCQALVYVSSSAEALYYCRSNPQGLYPSGASCSEYYDCSHVTHLPYGLYRQECPYPQQFDIGTRTCRDFKLVQCGTRREHKSPCDYLAKSMHYTGVTCTEPTCVGKTDGVNVGQDLGQNYYQCLQERTIKTSTCAQYHYFDPVFRECRSTLTQKAVNHYCNFHPNTKAENPVNCAQYINCNPVKPQIIECGYPRLFNGSNCIEHQSVTCGKRFEPISPCDYIQNQHCPGSALTCSSCEERIPSCKDLPDGYQPYPNRPPSPLFVRCLSKRTESVIKCRGDIYNPTTRQCGGKLAAAYVESVCKKYPGARFPSPENCARYYDCSKPVLDILNIKYAQECRYPQLYSADDNSCINIFQDLQTVVDCGQRKEPYDACEYQEHCGKGQYPTCNACRQRIPTCRGQPSRRYLNFPVADPNSSRYFLCFRDRTVVYGTCADSHRFDTFQVKCVTKFPVTTPLPRWAKK